MFTRKKFPIGVEFYNNKLLSKLAPTRKVEGDSERRTGVYTDVHEDSSTESTNKFSVGVEFQKKFIKNVGNRALTHDIRFHFYQLTLSRVVL